jgi:HEAT repeat protein
LKSDDYILFSAAVQTSLELPGAEVTQALTSEVSGLPADNQILITQALGKRGDAAALPTLFALAKSGAKSVRIAAIKAIPEISHASAVPVLVELLGDGDRQISQAAQETLAGLPGQQADAAVMAMLNSKETNRQLTGLELIGRRRMVTSSTC